MKMTGDEFKALYVKNGKLLPNNVTEITDDLFLSNNKISKIENLPYTINGTLYLFNNKIKKIENLPHTINGSLNLSYNKIFKIENLPHTINGYLYLSNNPIYSQFKNSNFTNQKEWAYTTIKLNIWKNL